MRQRPVRSGGSGQPDRMMWVVRSDEGGDGRTKMGTNPDRMCRLVNWQVNDIEKSISQWMNVHEAGMTCEVNCKNPTSS